MLHNGRRLRRLCRAIQSIHLNPLKIVPENPTRVIPLIQSRGKKDNTPLSSLFIPVHVKPNPDDINVGEELTGTLSKTDLLRVINKFYQKKEIKQLLNDSGLDRENCLIFK